MSKYYFVYILTNYKNNVFYVGITNDLERRTFEHKNHLNPDSFTAKYKLYKLVWFEEFNNPDEAIIVEKKIKGWKRAKKIELIESKNKELKNLFALR